jgi:hypothetical protein
VDGSVAEVSVTGSDKAAAGEHKTWVPVIHNGDALLFTADQVQITNWAARYRLHNIEAPAFRWPADTYLPRPRLIRPLTTQFESTFKRSEQKVTVQIGQKSCG